MSFLLMSSSAIYSSTLSNHTYVSVSLKGIMHQGSALCPLLFGVVMDVVPSEASSGIPSELLSELSIIYGNETRLLLDDGGLKFEKSDMQNFNSLA